jgi:hypothetical protein
MVSADPATPIRPVRGSWSFGVVVLAGLLVVFLVAGCGQGSPEQQRGGTTEGPSGTTEEQTRQETTSETPPTGETPFTAAPEMSGGSQGAADGILEVNFERREGYERAVLGFGSGGVPVSGVPMWSLSSPEGEGYARITFPGVDTTSVPDGLLGGSILDSFYVVRAPGGGLFVDIFATRAFQYRVTELDNPARLTIDYRPASVDLGSPIPVRETRTVLFEPRVGEAVTSPLRVSGYSRNPEASNTITLVDADGNVLSRNTVLSNDWLETWGYFEASLEFPPFEGQAMLRVGGQSARDGSFEGVEVPVVYGKAWE